jgi:hypothetical protein
MPGANPTIATYNAGVPNLYNTTGNLVRFEKKISSTYLEVVGLAPSVPNLQPLCND